MVVGNGLVGSMHFGPAERQVTVFNCHKFVLPNGAPFPVPDMSDMLEPMRDEMLAGNIGQGWRLYHDELLRRRGLEVLRKPYYGMVSSQSFHPGYQLVTNLARVGDVQDYRRSTDFETGEVKTVWRNERGLWVTRSFASRADNLLVTQLLPPQGHALELRLALEPAVKAPATVAGEVHVEEQYLNFRARYPEVNGRQGGYEGVTRVVLEGGESKVEGEVLRVQGALGVLLLTKLERYKDDYQDWNAGQLRHELEAVPINYDTLFEDHVRLHRDVFDRVEFSLGANEEDLSLPTEELLRREEADSTSVNRALIEKVFYASRYLFMASSGEHYAPRLCGMFTGAWGAAWAGDYTCDANVNLAVLGGNILDLPECMEGYFQVVERSLPQWREGAKQFYGCRGILGPIRIDGEVGIPIHCGPYHAHPTATGIGPWMLYPMFEHYLVTGDKQFLRDRVFPLLQEQARFYEDFLSRTDAQGRVIFVPSCSPENASAEVEPRTSAAVNSTMDIAACKHGLSMVLAAHRELGLQEDEETNRWRTLLGKMPPYLLTEDGALKEWAWPTYAEHYRHRHISHMYPVWPAYEINPDSSDTAHLTLAAAKALGKRPESMVQAHDALQRAASWIRLKRGDEFYKILKHLLEQGYLYDSLATSHNSNHEIYNYDAILCLQGLLAEMCVYTGGLPDECQIDLLPALPEAIDVGRIAGVMGRNQMRIDELEWDLTNRQIHCRLTSGTDQEVTVICRRGIGAIEGVETERSPLGDHARLLELSANQQVNFTVTWPLSGSSPR